MSSKSFTEPQVKGSSSLLALRKVVDYVSNLLGYISLVFLGFIVVAITIDVIARSAFDDNVPGLFELTEMSMVMVVFMGLGLTQRDNAHIRVTGLIDLLSGRKKRVAVCFSWLMASLALLMLAYPAMNEAIYSFSIKEFRWGYFEVPIWWAKIGVAIGLWFGFIQSLLHAVLVLLGHDWHADSCDK